MWGIRKWAFATAVAVLLLAFAAGCGGGSGSSSTQSSGGEPSAQFQDPKGGDDKVVKFGGEASEEEREAASSVLEANLEARAAADFATQCSTLNRKTVEEIAGPVKKGTAAGACPGALRKLAEPLKGSQEVRKDTLRGPITAMRVKSDRGYALYHGNDGNDYAMPMEKEGGEWKVGSLLTTELG